MSGAEIVLIVMAAGFAWSIGAHYTGACMGMPYGSGSIRLWPALTTMALFALAGAYLASHGVERTVGLHIIDAQRVTLVGAVVILFAAFLLTTTYTALRLPTSTIQILVFSVVGVALGAGIPISWTTILDLAVIWVLAPPVATALGYVFTWGSDRVVGARPHGAATTKGTSPPRLGLWPLLLVVVGVAASFTMGGNDVANATGMLVMTRTFDVWTAGLIGGVALMIGVLTWGKPLLKTVAFDIVHVDLPMATAAQFVQALVVFAAVVFGFFTSMNQALVGAMTGAGMARGRGSVEWKTVTNILKGWAIGPPSGLILGFLCAHLAGVWWAL